MEKQLGGSGQALVSWDLYSSKDREKLQPWNCRREEFCKQLIKSLNGFFVCVSIYYVLITEQRYRRYLRNSPCPK